VVVHGKVRVSLQCQLVVVTVEANFS
jgi:hypothetical protein